MGFVEMALAIPLRAKMGSGSSRNPSHCGLMYARHSIGLIKVTDQELWMLL